MSVDSNTRVCIVGAGPAGLSLARACKAQGVGFDVFERHSDVGGLWDPDNPGSAVYDTAHFISSKTQSHYHDFPMPDHYPDYPAHRHILAYMREFAWAYGLYPHIQFGTEVKRAEWDGRLWTITLSTGEVRQYGALICATGTNWHPAMPEYPGTFTGEIRHSVSYRSPSEFAGKRVLVIGGGNSGCDIACDAASMAKDAFISLRRGYHFIPKHIFGVPADEFAATGPQMPMWLEQRVFAVLLRLLIGDVSRLGLTKPDHRIFETHPILNTQLLHHLAHGDISAKPDVVRFDGKTVEFTDGTREEIDMILCATGYTWKIPYVDESMFRWKSGRPELYMNLFSRENRSLYALGYMETNGGAYKLFDEMADLVVRTVKARFDGTVAAATMDSLIASDQPDLRGGIKFVNSARHATYVEISAYRKHMKKLRRKLGWPELVDGVFETLRVNASR